MSRVIFPCISYHSDLELKKHFIFPCVLYRSDLELEKSFTIPQYNHQDCCLIPESPFHMEGKGELLEFIEKRLKENGHMVIVVAEGAGQELIAESMRSISHKDASGNKLLLDIGLWLSHKIKVNKMLWYLRRKNNFDTLTLSSSLQVHFKKTKASINLKYIGLLQMPKIQFMKEALSVHLM